MRDVPAGIELRRASSRDAPAIHEFVLGGISAYREWAPSWSPGPPSPEARERLQGLYDDDARAWAMLAWAGDEIVGLASLATVTGADPSALPEGTIYLWQMFVRPDRQGSGLAGALLDRLFAEARRVLRPGGRFVFLTPNSWNYNVWLIRLVPNRVHDHLTRRLYARQERDTFPVRYRVNSPRRLARTLAAAGFRRRQLVLNGDPTYVSFHPILFALARGVERVLDQGPLRQGRVHLLGVYEAV
jgi:GNAT superfamily N-acetyltransferase